MNNTGDTTAQHNIKLKGQSGVSRQIDVLITHKQGIFEHKILGECRYWKSKIKRSHVDEMVTAVKDLGASKGAIFTTKGFQSGAKKIAETNNIDLFLVRELTHEEWGRPGRHIKFYLHIIKRSIYNLEIPNPLKAIVLDPSSFDQRNTHLSIHLGNKKSKTPILNPDGTVDSTLEEKLEAATTKAMSIIFDKSFIFNSGKNGTYYISNPVVAPFTPPLRISLPGGLALLPELKFELALKIEQSLLEFDRMEPYVYALALEDCINRKSFVSAKKIENLSSINICSKQNDSDEEVLKNGSIIRVTTSYWFDPKEIEHLKPVPMMGKGD